MLAAALACSAGAWGLDPPRDVWADPEWQMGLLGLKPGAARSVRWTEQLAAPPSGDGEPVVVSYRASKLGFDDNGRLATLHGERQRRGERDQRLALQYQWSGQVLQRIDDEGAAEPLWHRRFDAAGRVVLEAERQGVVVRRTVFKYDAAGRETERVVEAAGGATRVRERRSYHINGALKSIDTESKGGSSSSSFDTAGRPVRRTVREAESMRVVQFRYPTAQTAVIDDSSASLTRGGLRKDTRELVLRVRRPEDLLGPGEPEQPLSRRETRNGRTTETQTDFDDEGRATAQRLLENNQLRCQIEWRYHASGLPLAVHARRPDGETRCPEQGDIDAEIEVDARGNWVRQVIHLTQPDGRRARVAEHTREIEYR